MNAEDLKFENETFDYVLFEIAQFETKYGILT
jgi:hypothetical protein